MNHSKFPLFNKLRKQITKAIKHAKDIVLSSSAQKEQDLLTAKELNKKFARAPRRKPIPCAKNNKHHKLSKRTTPGSTDNTSAPASSRREGKRWIKSVNQKISAQNTVISHHGGAKK